METSDDNVQSILEAKYSCLTTPDDFQLAPLSWTHTLFLKSVQEGL